MTTFRLAQLSEGRAGLDRAGRLFKRLVAEDPKDAGAWFGLAMTELEMAGRRYPPKGDLAPIGASFRESAGHHLLQAIVHDPTFVPAARELLALLRSPDPPVVGDDVMKTLGPSFRVSAEQQPAFFLLAARRAFEDDHLDSASHFMTAYVEAGGDRGVAALEQARIDFASGKADMALARYWDGVAGISTAASRAAYRDDLAWIATSDELVAFDSLPSGQLLPWVRAFWFRRDVDEGRLMGARLREHLRRYSVVMRSYRAPAHWRRRALDLSTFSETTGSFDEAQSGLVPGEEPLMVLQGMLDMRIRQYGQLQDLVDDRGVIYMRRGEPERRANYPGASHYDAESWRYQTPDGPVVVHFAGRPAMRLRRLPGGDLMSACQVAARFCVMAAKLGQRRLTSRDYDLARDLGERDIARALGTDGFPLTFDRILPLAVRFYRLRESRSGSPMVLIALAVQPSPNGIVQTAEGVGSSTTLRFRIGAIRHGGDDMITLDTARAYRFTAPPAPGTWLLGSYQVPVEQGLYRMSLVVEQPLASAGGGVKKDSVGTVEPHARAPWISDLLLGRSLGGLSWYGPDGPVPVDPLAQFTQREVLHLYYQVGNLTAGQRYDTRIGILASGGKRPRERLALQFDAMADQLEPAVRREIDLGDLKPGSYVLTVTITDESTGAAARREQPFLVTR